MLMGNCDKSRLLFKSPLFTIQEIYHRAALQKNTIRYSSTIFGLFHAYNRNIISTNLGLLINLINNGLKEVQCILLFTDVDRCIGPKPEYLPESLRGIELQFAFHQMSQHRLNLIKDAVMNRQMRHKRLTERYKIRTLQLTASRKNQLIHTLI